MASSSGNDSEQENSWMILYDYLMSYNVNRIKLVTKAAMPDWAKER